MSFWHGETDLFGKGIPERTSFTDDEIIVATVYIAATWVFLQWS